MPTLIKDGAVAVDGWQFLSEESLNEESLSEESLAASPDAKKGAIDSLPAGKVIVPIALWLEHREALRQRLPDIAVWLQGHEDPEPLAADTGELPLIAVNFPVFSDGRGFSTGRLLRERYGFGGELRATGYYLREQLCYLRRCGFNAFSLDDRYDPQAALSSLEDFSEYYQSSFDQPLPLFRRRA